MTPVERLERIKSEIEELYGDTSISRGRTRSLLEEIVDHTEGFLGALADVEIEGE